MKLPEWILEALNDVGDDLVDMAESMRFPISPWRRIAPLAACLAVLIGLGAAAYVWLPQSGQPSEDAALSQPEEEQDAARPEAWVWDPEPLPFYELALHDDIIGPAVAVDNAGNVLVETDQGFLEPLIDWETGEYLAIIADPRSETVPRADNRLLVYDLEGNLVQELTAWGIDCLGDTVIVSYADHAALYSRASGALIRDDLTNAWVAGSCIQAVPLDGSAQYLLLDGNAAETARIALGQEMGGFWLWKGETYFSFHDSEGRWGIVDSHGNWIVEQTESMDDVSCSNGYAICRQEQGGYYAVDLESGEIILESPYDICIVFDQGAVVQLENGAYTVIDRQGTPLFPACQSIRVLDDEGDRTMELLVLIGFDGTCRFLRRDGTVQLELNLGNANVHYISSRTALRDEPVQDESGAWVTDFALIDLETGAENRDFARPYSYGAPLWFSREDGSAYATGLFTAEYPDADGKFHTDLLREDGTVLLEDLTDSLNSYMGGGVFSLERDGVYMLARLDGTILYEQETK